MNRRRFNLAVELSAFVAMEAAAFVAVAVVGAATMVSTALHRVVPAARRTAGHP